LRRRKRRKDGGGGSREGERMALEMKVLGLPLDPR
jgi:hypothetical protein